MILFIFAPGYLIFPALLVENSILFPLGFFFFPPKVTGLRCSWPPCCLVYLRVCCHLRAAPYGGSFSVFVKSSEVSSPPFPFPNSLSSFWVLHMSQSWACGGRVAPEAQGGALARPAWLCLCLRINLSVSKILISIVLNLKMT